MKKQNKNSNFAIVVRVNGTIDPVSPEKGNAFALEELQTLVGGFIEIVPGVRSAKVDRIFVVDEEGLLKERDRNALASYIAGQAIFGDAVYCDSSMVK